MTSRDDNDKPRSPSFYTGLPGIDREVIPDGIPMRSLNVIGGGPGTGKTILSLQMLFTNASPDNRAIYFTTISEPTIKFLAYLQDFDFYDADKMFSSIVVRDIGDVIQKKPLPEVIDTINGIIREENARLVVIDSFKAISDIVPQAEQLRVFAYDLAVNLVSSMCTAFLVGEYTLADMAEVPIFAIADGIVNLSFQQDGLNRQRYLEVHKIRGRKFVHGLHPFTITSGGITVYPRIRTSESFEVYQSPEGKASTGLADLDTMLDGGFPRGSTTMVAGGAGTGKTLMGLHFITEGVQRDEPGAIVTFQEDPVQLRQVASSFGWDLAAMEAQGLLVHLYNSPVEIQPDIHTAHVKTAVERIGARRVLIDSLKDLEIATPDKVRFKDYVYSLVNHFKQQGITTLLTNEIAELFGPFTLSEFGVSFIADNIILLRYVELGGLMGRALSVLKVRGSQHQKQIRRFEISNQGFGVGPIVEAATGVLSGTPVGAAAWDRVGFEPAEQYLLNVLRKMRRATTQEIAEASGFTEVRCDDLLLSLAERGMVISARTTAGWRYKTSASYGIED